MELSSFFENVATLLKQIKEWILVLGLMLVTVGGLCFLVVYLLSFWSVLETVSYDFARFSAGIGCSLLALYFTSNMIVAYVDAEKREHYRQVNRLCRRLDK